MQSERIIFQHNRAVYGWVEASGDSANSFRSFKMSHQLALDLKSTKFGDDVGQSPLRNKFVSYLAIFETRTRKGERSRKGPNFALLTSCKNYGRDKREITLNLGSNIWYTLCPKKRPPFYFFNNCQKSTDFNNFWCVESWGNLTPPIVGDSRAGCGLALVARKMTDQRDKKWP